MKKVCLAGNHNFPLGTPVATQVVDTIKGLGPDIVILTRGSAGFDRFVENVALVLGIRCFRYPGKGGADNLERDTELVADADEVHGFFNLDDFEAGVSSGTYWLVAKALKAGKPTYAWTCVDEQLIHVGSPAESETA